MQPTLFNLSDELRSLELQMDEWAEEHEGDITDFPLKDRMDALGALTSEKALGIAVLIKELKTFGESIKGEGQPFIDLGKSYIERGEAKLNKAKRLQDFLASVLPQNSRFEDNRAKIWFQNNGGKETVEVYDGVLAADFPEKFHKPQPIVIDMDAVREAAEAEEGMSARFLKAGDKVLARVFRSVGIRIK